MPSTSVLTSFTQADGAPTGFSQAISSYSVPSVVSNALNWPQYPSLYWNASTFAEDQEAFVKMPGTGSSVSLLLRLTNPNSGSETCYRVEAALGNSESAHAEAWKIVAGAQTSLGYTNFVMASTDVWMWVKVVGSTITLYGSADGTTWISRKTWTDTAVTGAGYIGLYDQNNATTTSLDEFGGGALPSSTTFEVAAAADDGSGYKTGASYPPTSSYVAEDGATLWAWKGSTSKEVDTSYVRWDTAAISDTATITAVSVRLYITQINNTDSRNLNCDYYDFGGEPSVSADWTDSVGTTGFSVAISSLTLNAWNEISLSNLSSVNKSGYTGLRFGISGGSPTGANDVAIKSYEYDTAFSPELVVYISGTAHTKSLSDTVTLSDSASNAVGLTKTDTATLTDNLTRAWAAQHTNADTITLSDTPSKAVGLVRSDTTTISDALTKSYGMAAADTVTLTDAIAKSVGKSNADTLTLTDVFNFVLGGGTAHTLSLADTVTLTDLVVKGMGLAEADIITLVDSHIANLSGEFITGGTARARAIILGRFGIY